MSDAAELKEQGNTAFGQKKFMEAVDLYSKALAAMHGQDQTDESFDLVLTLFANRALACLKLDEPRAALEDCERGLSFDESHVKLRYRRGLAFVALNNIPDAKAQFANLITDGAVDEATRKLARDELQKIAPKKETVVQAQPVMENVTSTTVLSANDKATNPGMFKESAAVFGGESAIDILKAAKDGKLTLEQEKQLQLIIGASPAVAPPVKDEQDEEVVLPMGAEIPEGILPASSAPPKTVGGVWKEKGGSALVDTYTQEDTFISSERNAKATRLNQTHMDKPVSVAERIIVNKTYSPLAEDGSSSQPPVGRAALSVISIVTHGDRVLVVCDGPSEHGDAEVASTPEPTLAKYAGRRWKVPQTEVGATESPADAAARVIREQCLIRGQSIKFTPLSIASIEDYSSLRDPHVFRLAFVGSVSDIDVNDLKEDIPADATFAWVPISILGFSCPLDLSNPDTSITFENIPNLASHATTLENAVGGAVPAGPMWIGSSYSMPPTFDAPGVLGHHVVELALLSAPHSNPQHIHILLNRSTVGWELPATHLDRSETITFAARRIARGAYGVVMDEFSCASVAGGVFSAESEKKINASFDEIAFNEQVRAADAFEEETRNYPVPVSSNEAENVVRGLRFTIAGAFAGCGPNVSSPPPACLQGGAEMWPQIDSEMDVNDIPPHRWFSLEELVSMPSSLIGTTTQRTCLNLIANATKCIRAGPALSNAIPTHLGLAALLNIDTLSQQLNEPQP